MNSQTLDHNLFGTLAPDVASGWSASIRGPVKAGPVLAAEASRLARSLRRTTSFTLTVGCYLGTPLHRQPRLPDSPRQVSCSEALLLDVEPGREALCREGWLVPQIAGPLFRAATISALVLEHRLGLTLTERQALRQGEIPLGQLLRGAERSTHYAYTVATRPKDDFPVVHVQGTLLLSGTPVALVRETVLWRVLTHRNQDWTAATAAVR